MKINWNTVVDGVQSALIWFVIVIVALCTSVLILFDVLAGMGIMDHLMSGNTFAALLVSLATTGLLMALMGIGYMLVEQQYALVKSIGFALLGMAFIVYCMDVVFDALTADVLRYGQIAILSNLPQEERAIHILFRSLIGGISTVGEALAVSLIAGMPILKKFINNSLSNLRSYSSTQPPMPPRYNQSIISMLPKKPSQQPDELAEDFQYFTGDNHA